MFKRLKEKITEEVSKSPLRLQTVQTQIGQYSPFNGAAKKPSDSQGSSESDAPTQNDGQNLIDLQENSSSIMDVSESQQFSIADEDGASSATASPIPQPQFQRFENVDLTANHSALAGSVGRPRTSSVSSTGSQAPFFPVYSPMQSSYSIQSDLESTSEMEDAGVNLDIISKEQLYQAFQKAKAKYTRYKARYGDAVKAYREQVNEKEKIKTILTESQDKALRRISELREQSQLEQKAKAHLEDSFRVTLEEKDELLRVLHTQIRLLKNGEDPTEKQDDDDTQNHLIDVSSDSVKSDNEEASEVNTQLKFKTYEETIVKLKSLLRNCKDTIVKHRENNVRLASEKDQLAEKLNEANAQLKHFMEDKSEKDRDLLNDLMQASQTIESYKTKEAEDALSMAETKRLMHEEMEVKENKLQDIKVELHQLYVEKEELQKSVEEKSKEISEIELKCQNEVESAKQRLEEAEKMLEDEKQSLLQELSRGKAAAIQLMQQEADKRLKEMEDQKFAALQSLELEWQTKMEEKVKEEIEILVKQDALESTVTMSDHFTNQIATLKREVQEKETQLKQLIEEKTLFQEQIQEQCSRQTAMENDIAQMTLEKNSFQEVFNRLQQPSGTHPLLSVKDAVSAKFNELRSWLVEMKLDVSERINESAERFSEVNSEFFKLSQAHDSLLGTIESLKLENENYAEENGRFKDEFDTAQQKIMHLEGQLTDSSTALEQLQSQLDAGEAALKSTEEKLVAVSEQLRQLEHEREEMLQELACLKLLRDDLDVLNERAKRSSGEIAILHDELAAKDAEISVLVARNDQLNDSCKLAEALRSDLLARDSKISDLEVNLSDQHRNSCAELNLLKQSLELELKELQDARDASAGSHAAEIETVNERLRIELERNEALLKMQSTLSSAPMESKALQCHLDAEATSAGSEHETQLLEVNQQLMLELDNVKNVTERLKVEMDSLREQLDNNKVEYEQHISKLSNEIDSKQRELQRLESLQDSQVTLKQENENLAVENLRRTCEGLQKEKDDLSSRLAEKENTIERFKNEENEWSVKLGEHAATVRQFEEEKNDLSASLAEKIALVKRLEEEKSELSANLSEKDALLIHVEEMKNSWSEKLSENVTLLHRLEEEKVDLSVKLAEKAGLLKQLEEEKSDLSASLTAKVALVTQLENDKNDWSARLSENAAFLQQAEDEKNDLSRTLAEKVAGMQQLEEEKGNWNAKLIETIALAQRHESELASLRLDFEKCQEELLVKTGLSEQLTTKVGSLESKFAVFEQKAAQAELIDAEASRLGEHISSLETQMVMLRKEKENLERTRDELSEINASQVHELRELEEKRNQVAIDLQSAIRRHSEDMEGLEKSHKGKMNELVQKFKLKLKSTNQEHTEQLAKMENAASVSELLQVTVEDLKLKVQNAEKESAQNVVNLKAAGREFSELSDQFDLAKEENEKLKRALEEATGHFNSIDGENQSFVQEIANLQMRISTLQETLESRDKELENVLSEAACAHGDKEQLQKAMDATSLECQKLQDALNEALAEKSSLKSELKEQVSELQATTILMEAEIADLQARVQESASFIKELQAQKADLEQKMLDERKEQEALMQQSLQQVNEENQSKLADLRKRAENKLAQIKKQLVYDADKTKEELELKIASLEEQKRKDDETCSEKLTKERDNVRLEFQEKIERLEASLQELQAALDNERSRQSEEKEALIAELAVKNSQIDESLINAQDNQAGMSQRISNLQMQLEQAAVSHEACEKELVELRGQLAEKEELTQLLESQLKAESESSEYERILECKDEEHAIKIKQLVKEFSVMIAEKEEDGQQALAKAIETSLNEDNRLRREHAVHLNEIQNEFGEKELSFEMALEEKQSIIQEKSAELEKCSQAYEEKMDLMKTEHQRQMQELEKKWKAMLRKELKQQAAMHEEDVNGLTQEWQMERKFAPAIDYNSVAKIEVMQEELQQQTHLASSAIESGGQSSELLRRQIMTMQTQMEMLKDRHKAEVSELHQILQASNCPVPSGKSVGKGIFKDRPALQSLEIEYLKNILFEYMMGRETLTLAKVIATVVQFSDEQLNKILEKEESRGGGVSGQLGQMWK